MRIKDEQKPNVMSQKLYFKFSVHKHTQTAVHILRKKIRRMYGGKILIKINNKIDSYYRVQDEGR
jgi:hypothetical protein